MHAELVPARFKHFFLTMGTLKRSPPKQLPIPTGRAIKPDAMPDPIAILYSFSTMRADRLVIGDKHEWHDHGKIKNNADKCNGQRDRLGQLCFRKHMTRHDCAAHKKQKHTIANDRQNTELAQLPSECRLIKRHQTCRPFISEELTDKRHGGLVRANEPP